MRLASLPALSMLWRQLADRQAPQWLRASSTTARSSVGELRRSRVRRLVRDVSGDLEQRRRLQTDLAAPEDLVSVALQRLSSLRTSRMRQLLLQTENAVVNGESEASPASLQLAVGASPSAPVDLEELAYQTVLRYCRDSLADELRLRSRLASAADMSAPASWFPLARARRRRVIFHAGKTNSGKTYQALQRLMAAESGVYCGPLRLLAWEVYDRLNRGGVPCALLTGQERELPPRSSEEHRSSSSSSQLDREEEDEDDDDGDDDAHPPDTATGQRSAYLDLPGDVRFVSCTVEMADVHRPVQVGVVDEVQMIASRDRGGAWTRAILGLPVEELHLCGCPSAVPIVRQLVEGDCGDSLELRGAARPARRLHRVVFQARRVSHQVAAGTTTTGQVALRGDLRLAAAGDTPAAGDAVQRAGFALGAGGHRRRGHGPQLERAAGDLCRPGKVRWRVPTAIVGGGGFADRRACRALRLRAPRRRWRYRNRVSSGGCAAAAVDYLWCRIRGQRLAETRVPGAGAARRPGAHAGNDGDVCSIQRQDEADAGAPSPGLSMPPLSTLYERFEQVAQLDESGKYFVCDLSNAKTISRLLERARVAHTVPFSVRYTASMAPLKVEDSSACEALVRFVELLGLRGTVRLDASGCSWGRYLRRLGRVGASACGARTVAELSDLESLYHVLDLYLWLANRYPEAFVDCERAAQLRAVCADAIEHSLRSSLRLPSRTVAPEPRRMHRKPRKRRGRQHDDDDDDIAEQWLQEAERLGGSVVGERAQRRSVAECVAVGTGHERRASRAAAPGVSLGAVGERAADRFGASATAVLRGDRAHHPRRRQQASRAHLRHRQPEYQRGVYRRRAAPAGGAGYAGAGVRRVGPPDRRRTGDIAGAVSGYQRLADQSAAAHVSRGDVPDGHIHHRRHDEHRSRPEDPHLHLQRPAQRRRRRADLSAGVSGARRREAPAAAAAAAATTRSQRCDGTLLPQGFRGERLAGAHGALLEHEQRPDHRAHHHAAPGADHRRVPGVRLRAARVGDSDGHGLVLRRVAGGECGARGGARAARLPVVHVLGSELAVRACGAHRGAHRLHHPNSGGHHAQRRHHPSDSGPDRIHHRGADLPGCGAAQSGGLPAGQPVAVAVA
eukprot:ctg_208.g128